MIIISVLNATENVTIKPTSTAPSTTEEVSIRLKNTKEAIEYQNKIVDRLHHGKRTIQPTTSETDEEDDSDIKGESVTNLNFWTFSKFLCTKILCTV